MNNCKAAYIERQKAIVAQLKLEQELNRICQSLIREVLRDHGLEARIVFYPIDKS